MNLMLRGVMTATMAFASSMAVAQNGAPVRPVAVMTPAPQAAIVVPPSQLTVIAGAPSYVLRAGTPIPMRTAVALTTKGKNLRVGERVPLEVAEAISLNGQIVIPAGSTGMAEVTTVRNKGMWGKSGAINARVLYVRVGDRQIRLSGSFDDKGVTGTVGVVAAIAFVPIAGFFTTGTSAMIPAGAPISAFLDEDVPVTLAAGVPAPVQAVAPAVAEPTTASH